MRQSMNTKIMNEYDIYYLLDKDDVTNICGEIKKDKLMKSLGIKDKCKFNAWLSYGQVYKKKYIVVEKMFKPERKGVNVYIKGKLVKKCQNLREVSAYLNVAYSECQKILRNKKMNDNISIVYTYYE